MTTPLVYIVIPAWNRKHDTLACLESLLALTYPSYRIVMVDNGSTDGTAQAVGENYLNVEIIAHPKNLGFAAGVNSGIRHALERGADFVFLLNNDTLAEPSLLNRLLAYCTAGVGIVAPKIYYAADPERLWSAGGQRHPWTLEKTDDARGQPDGPRWARVLERDYLVGCAMLIPRSTLQRVGEFDERYFMYYEDMDFSWRVRAAGLKLLVAPDARLWHKVALSSGGSDSPNERYWMARGSVLFFRRYARGWRWLVVGPYRFGSAIKTTLRLLARGRWEAIAAYWRGLRDGMVQP
ncbi:MAG: glycosyltransferase family 2 protein [Anaerolineales bacterium]